MATLTVGSRVYQDGEDIVNVPQRANLQFTSYEIRFTREAWPSGLDCVLADGRVMPNTVMEIGIQRSDDGGNNWREIYSTTFEGGVLATAESAIIVEPTGTDSARLRFRVKRFVPLRTSISATVVEP